MLVSIWLQTQHFQTNWFEGILLHMNHSKQSQIMGLPYEVLITEILVAFGINTMGEIVDSTNNKIDYSSLRRMNICLYHGELRNKSMDEDKDISQPTAKDKTINNLMEMCQSNSLSIQNVAKDIAIIKKNISRNNDTYGNMYHHLYFSYILKL